MPPSSRGGRLRPAAAFAGGGTVGVLGGLVGLGGAEFRLPLLLGVFAFAALAGVILNKAMSLVVVLAALPARLTAVPLAEVATAWLPAVNLLAGSLLGAWVGASWATRMRTTTLQRILAALRSSSPMCSPPNTSELSPQRTSAPVLVVAGVLAGFGIGIVAAIMGVAGGELLFPTLVLLYETDVALASSLSLLMSLPTMLIAFVRYSRGPGLRRPRLP